MPNNKIPACFLMLFVSQTAYAYKVEVHSAMSEFSAKNSALATNELWVTFSCKLTLSGVNLRNSHVFVKWQKKAW